MIVAGADRVDLGEALRAARRARAPGWCCARAGPSLNGQLVAADLIDESCVTVVAPAGRRRRRPHHARRAGATAPRPMRLARVLDEGDMLLLRYVRA